MNPELLAQVAEGVYIRPMLTINDAIDFACSGLAAKTRADYTRLLHRFANQFPRTTDIAKVGETDCLRFLANRDHLAPGTRAWQEIVLNSFFHKLYQARKIKTNPMEFVPRTRRPDPEALNLKTVSSAEVSAMFAVAETWPEKLCIALLAYLGPRRHAAAMLRTVDHDLDRGRLRFHEKGGKTIWKPIPTELSFLIEQARWGVGILQPAPEDWLIPNEGPRPVGSLGPRCDRVVWRITRRLAKRANVDAHTHSIRAAFADFYLDSGGDGKALQLLMGHKNPATTERYTRRYDRERRMEEVRHLSWQQLDTQILANSDGRLGDPVVVGAGGFEPPQVDPIGLERAVSLQRALRLH